MKIFSTSGNNDDASYLLPSDYGTLANYFVKFLRGYAQAKVPVAAVTPQNEPGQGTWYPGLNLPEWAEASFVADYLKPALRRARLKTAIFGYDSTWSNAPPSLRGALLTGPAGQDLAGIAFHCYYGTPTVMSALHRQEPKLEQWVTECTSQTDPILVPSGARDRVSSQLGERRGALEPGAQSGGRSGASAEHRVPQDAPAW